MPSAQPSSRQQVGFAKLTHQPRSAVIFVLREQEGWDKVGKHPEPSGGDTNMLKAPKKEAWRKCIHMALKEAKEQMILCLYIARCCPIKNNHASLSSFTVATFRLLH